jgi:hypothetical protein
MTKPWNAGVSPLRTFDKKTMSQDGKGFEIGL